MKENSKTHSQLKTLWNSVFFSFTYSGTAAGSRPSRLFPANLVDFVYGVPHWGQMCRWNCPSVYIDLSVTHSYFVQRPWAIISYSLDHLDAVIICQSISLPSTEPGDTRRWTEWLPPQAACYLCVCVCVCVTNPCMHTCYVCESFSETPIHAHNMLSPA